MKVRFFERAIEQLVHHHVFTNLLPGGGSLSFANEVSPPHRFRRQSDCRGNLIHVSFQSKQRLRSAKSPKCAVWRNIRRQSRASYAHIGAFIRSSSMNGSAGKHHWSERCISASVDGEVDLHSKNLAIALRSSSVSNSRWMPFGGSHQIFAAVVN